MQTKRSFHIHDWNRQNQEFVARFKALPCPYIFFDLHTLFTWKYSPDILSTSTQWPETQVP